MPRFAAATQFDDLPTPQPSEHVPAVVVCILQPVHLQLHLPRTGYPIQPPAQRGGTELPAVQPQCHMRHIGPEADLPAALTQCLSPAAELTIRVAYPQVGRTGETVRHADLQTA